MAISVATVLLPHDPGKLYFGAKVAVSLAGKGMTLLLNEFNMGPSPSIDAHSIGDNGVDTHRRADVENAAMDFFMARSAATEATFHWRAFFGQPERPSIIHANRFFEANEVKEDEGECAKSFKIWSGRRDSNP